MGQQGSYNEPDLPFAVALAPGIASEWAALSAVRTVVLKFRPGELLASGGIVRPWLRGPTQDTCEVSACYIGAAKRTADHAWQCEGGDRGDFRRRLGLAHSPG